MRNPRKIVIAGGTGFVGRLLTDHFSARGDVVHVLTRGEPHATATANHHHWDGKTQGKWAAILEGADAVINLAGKNVSCRYTATNLAEIDTSRVDSVAAITTAVNACTTPPPVLLQASTTAIYGDAGDARCAEDAPLGYGIPVTTASKWELAFHNHPTPGTRRVLLRLSFVLGNSGGALTMLDLLTRAFLGGTVGNGRQYISWLHPGDLCAITELALADETVQGTYNLAAPDAVTNREFMRTLRSVRCRPWAPPTPAPLVHLGCALLGTAPVLALTGRRAVPKRLLDHGYNFRYSDLRVALTDLLK